MVAANVKIIEELKSFLDIVSEEPEIRKLFTESEGDFTRDRKLPLEKIAGIIINMPKRSLSIELQEFFDSLGDESASGTKGAFSLQRTKLQPLFFEIWNQWLVTAFYTHYGDKVKRWRGFRLQAIDGSTAYLINKPDVVAHFGVQANQFGSIAMARVMQVQDILNDITVKGEIHPIKTSEKAIMANMVSHLYEDSLTMFDRGFPSFALMYLMLNEEEMPRHLVMRCTTVFNKEVRQFMLSSKCSKVVEMHATPKAIETLRKQGHIVTSETTIKIRMVKIRLSNGDTEILLTDLYDEKLFTLEDLKYLYNLRWGIETTYGKQKNQLQMEQFSGHRVLCIKQDYAAGIFVANVQSLVEKQCENYLIRINKKRKHEYKINRNVSWASLKFNIVKLFLDNEPEQILLKLQKAFERNIEPIRQGRKFPRVVKGKRMNGKYQTFTNYKRAI